MKVEDLPQPFALYRFFSGLDSLHFGDWSDAATAQTVASSMRRMSDKIIARFPKPPARILDVGCGLGEMAARLHQAGYEVVAITPDTGLLDYACIHHAGPDYQPCGFLENHAALQAPSQYDVILFQESLQYMPDLEAVFSRLGEILEPEKGRLLICDEVSYDPQTQQDSSIHPVSEIEQQFAAHGFFVRHHELLGDAVAPTCDHVLGYINDQRDAVIAAFSEGIDDTLNWLEAGWTQQKHWYAAGQLGYEFWDLRPSIYPVKGYQHDDEQKILETFQRVFQVSRSAEHWQWKFKQIPFGQSTVSSAWDGNKIVAHFTAYPVPLWIDGHNSMLGHHVGDTLTDPAYRGIGRGKTSLLARVRRHYARVYCENKIFFSFGFNTGKILRFGKMFLNYHAAAPVYEWFLEGDNLPIPSELSLWQRLKGYEVDYTENVAEWGDQVFEAARTQYGWLVARTTQYLQWRYQNHPDYRYQFFIVRKRGRPVGWWLGRVENKTLILGDALFIKNAHTQEAALLALQFGLAKLQQEGCEITQIRGWFSTSHLWWKNILEALNFRAELQHQDLQLCVDAVDKSISNEEIGQNFYFTQGDSDLF